MMEQYGFKMKKKIMPPTYFFILLGLSILFHFILPIKKIIFIPYSYFGWLLILFGAVLNLWTDALFKKHKTTVKPGKKSDKFIIEGPFKISRHPMYLGMFCILLGVAIIHGSLSGFIFPAVFIILMEKLFIKLEEEEMSKFKAYKDYKKRVRKWI